MRRAASRGSRSKKADPKALNLGACIDCNLCVQVCPTGIDIRKGLQYECIGCAACIDVCDDVMKKMNYALAWFGMTLRTGWPRASRAVSACATCSGRGSSPTA